ncbi:MAG: AMP-binding protein [Streptosporangiales bacterium]|nr:AMP-binding protein [Streptosporangiales bacterium]
MDETSSRLAESRLGYAPDWYEWRDPEIPQRLSPTELLLDKHLDTARADKAALVADDVPYTYRELHTLVERTAAGLADLGVRAGCRLLLVGTDSVEYVALWLACVRVGVVPVVVSDQVKAAQLAYYLDDVEPAVLYVDAAQLPKLAEAVAELGTAPPLVLVRGDATADAGTRTVPVESLTASQAPPVTPVRLHAGDVAYMLYSGSTTGPAKGVTHLAHDFVLVPERQGAFWEYTEDDVVHATSKKFFTHGLWPGVLIPLYWGGTAVVGGAPPSGSEVVRIVETYRPTKLITVPTTVKAILQYADEAGRTPDFSSVGLVITASEQVPTEIAVRFDKLFGLELLDSIGSSEVTYEWIANRQRDFRRGTLGRPVFGYEVKLVDAEGDEVTEPGVEGEAWVRSRTACLFYWRKYDATRSTFIGPWTRTGDMLALTGDGYFQFVGRRDDLFKVSGMWVSPLEVEGAIATSPSVHEVAVVGVTDASGLARPKAFVVLRGGARPSEELTADLRARVREVGGYKVPDEIAYVEALPRTPLMKINRRALRLAEAAAP